MSIQWIISCSIIGMKLESQSNFGFVTFRTRYLTLLNKQTTKLGPSEFQNDVYVFYQLTDLVVQSEFATCCQQGVSCDCRTETQSDASSSQQDADGRSQVNPQLQSFRKTTSGGEMVEGRCSTDERHQAHYNQNKQVTFEMVLFFNEHSLSRQLTAKNQNRRR